jgi:hypothetical protein
MPRPRITPTDEQRRLVKSLSACGIPHEQIARQIGIRSPKTVRKYFRTELDGGALEANAQVAKTLYQMATSGQCPSATMFWLRFRAGWREASSLEPNAVQAPPFIVAQQQGGQ